VSAPERLYAYLDALWQRRYLTGAIVEVGCWLGGTSAVAWKMLAHTGHPHRYVAIDTFSGFVPEQFAHDVQLGTSLNSRDTFNGSSAKMVRRLLDHWGAPGVELLEADIVSLPADQLPQEIAVCLVDVDLEIPVLESLRRVFPLLQRGGVILVDDCPEEPREEKSRWAGARIGYQRFVREHGLGEKYFMDMGIVST
jgi:predicted O-methyltransferase YrrM